MVNTVKVKPTLMSTILSNNIQHRRLAARNKGKIASYDEENIKNDKLTEQLKVLNRDITLSDP